MKVLLDQTIFQLMGSLSKDEQCELIKIMGSYPKNRDCSIPFWGTIRTIFDKKLILNRQLSAYAMIGAATRWSSNKETNDNFIEKELEQVEQNPFILLTANEEIHNAIRNPQSSISQFIENGSCYNELTRDETEFVDRGDVRKLCEWSKCPIEKKDKEKETIIPTIEEWLLYCRDKKLDEKRMKTAYEGYAIANWKDSNGKRIKNWKQKILHVWCAQEYNSTQENKRKRKL